MSTENGTTKPSDYYDRYSRQHYVLGEHAMSRMGRANVLVSGMGGVGIEIAKNVALAGVKRLVVHDTKVVSTWDLNTQYYLSEEDAGKNRATVSIKKLGELNPYVITEATTQELGSDLSFLDQFHCVILTDASLELQLQVNDYCRQHKIGYISADTYGAFAVAFADFGDVFEVFDKNGESPKEVMLQRIDKGTETHLFSLENNMHGLEEGDWVKFSEIQGMTELNYADQAEYIHRVKKVVTPYEFVIETDSTGFSDYTTGGIAIEVKKPFSMNFLSLRDALQKPDFVVSDLAKFEQPGQLHIAVQALHQFVSLKGQFPRPWNSEDSDALVAIARDINEKSSAKVDPLNETLVKQLSWTARGNIIGLTAFLGGIMAQEVIKCLSGKFTPLHQWLYFDAVELLPDHTDASFNVQDYTPSGNRYDGQVVLIGKKNNDILLNGKTFMIGAGAIGCEMIKNFALLGISSGANGKITVTDNDLIEKSNLNRQFLFRDHDLQKPKSSTAARAALSINKDLKIDAHLDKVGTETEDKYSNAFFHSLDVVVNALDNVQARMYVDQRCVTNQRPLLESGTLGTKGHVQVILPHLTETYASQHDPPEESFPVCTVKSFPAAIPHTVQWARGKFESLFNSKPAELQKFFEDPSAYIKSLRSTSGPKMNRLRHLVKVLENRPQTFADCVSFARIKFESYFTNLVLNLLHAFPLDTMLKDGSLFWKLPKRPPTELKFDVEQQSHFDFVKHTALLYANLFRIGHTDQEVTAVGIKKLVASVKVPEFVPKNKKIETDVNAKEEKEELNEDELDKLGQRLQGLVGQVKAFPVDVQEFEKDDDSNFHIDFITACSNLRAENYKIAPADRLETKRIAGKIIPAIATTTAAVAGLVSIEFVKIFLKRPLASFKNTFMNLAFPSFVMSEPAECQKTFITKDKFFTLWDQWELRRGDILLQDFCKHFEDEHNLTVTGVFQDVSMLYVSMLPGHKPRLKKKMSQLLKNITPEMQYIDLIVSFADDKGDDVNGPFVRYWIK